MLLFIYIAHTLEREDNSNAREIQRDKAEKERRTKIRYVKPSTTTRQRDFLIKVSFVLSRYILFL
jgi:hypothetical protein